MVAMLLLQSRWTCLASGMHGELPRQSYRTLDIGKPYQYLMSDSSGPLSCKKIQEYCLGRCTCTSIKANRTWQQRSNKSKCVPYPDLVAVNSMTCIVMCICEDL